MLNKLKNLYKILDLSDQRKVFFLFLMMLFAVLLEVVSIASILPLTREFFEPGENLMFLKNIKFLSTYEGVYILIIFFLLIYLFKFMYLFFFYYIQNKFINNLSAKLTTQLFNTYLFKNYEFHTQNNSSTMVRNLVTEIKLLCSSFVYPVFMLIIESTIILGILIFLFNYEVIISIAMGLIFLVLILVYFLAVKKKFLKWGNERQNLNKLSLKFSLQGLNGIKEIMVYSKENTFKSIFSKNEYEFASVSKLYQTFQQLPRLLFEFIIILLLISLMFFLKYQDLPNSKIFEILGVFTVASIRFIPSASRIIGSLQLLRYATPSMDVILNENMLSKEKINEIIKKQNNNEDYNFLDSIILKNLSFKFSNKDEFILKNINLELKKNEIIGIYGPSGSGKSTMVDLICGLLKPTSGTITMDGQSVEKNIFSWRKKFGYVTQKTYLIDDTIKNNILFGENKSFDYLRLQDSIKLSQLYNFIKQLPEGMETIVGERGAMLSGGQIQRIGIARAIYHKSEVLIFDEATNSLDVDSEQKIIDEIVGLKDKKTIIMISHKMSVLKVCNKIYEVKDKKLVLKNE
jgi:ABC-type bacteriocin/lantibiotic exporter with double-glycine peptidase domain